MMNSMNPNEIKKALDVLKSWQYLAYHNDDGTDEDSHELYKALTLVFDLINRLNAENERLKTGMKKLVDKQRLYKDNVQATREFQIEQAKSEAVKEFDEILKEDCLSCPLEKGDVTMLVDVDSYNNLVNEMVVK